MRIRGLLVLGWAAICVAGCAAGTKPCMMIPAQIDLARDARDAAKGTMETKRGELSRAKMNLEQSQNRLARMTEERDQLKKEVGGAPTQESKTQEPKQEEKK